LEVILIGAGVTPAGIQNGVCRNVQLMPTLFLKLTKIPQRQNGISSISTISLTFEDVPARNAFEYLQMIYIARN